MAPSGPRVGLGAGPALLPLNPTSARRGGDGAAPANRSPESSAGRAGQVWAVMGPWAPQAAHTRPNPSTPRERPLIPQAARRISTQTQSGTGQADGLPGRFATPPLTGPITRLCIPCPAVPCPGALRPAGTLRPSASAGPQPPTPTPASLPRAWRPCPSWALAVRRAAQ